MKNAIVFLFAAVLTISLSASADPGNSARVDIFPVKGDVYLTPGSAECGTVSNMNWFKAEDTRKKHITANFPASSEWKQGSFSFTPDKDGVICVQLLGGYAKNPSDMSWVLFNDVKVQGSELKNGSFEENAADWWMCGPDGGKGTVVEVSQICPKSAKVNHNGRLGQNIQIKAGQPITISFWYKLAE